jgi:F-type H+-transporting ATPase subunit epsilon
MSGTFKFELVSPEKILMSGDAEQVMLPGIEGEMTILAGHSPVISVLRPGVIDIAMPGSRARIYVKSGFAEVEPGRVTVLAEKAIDMSEMDTGRIADELKAAEADLADAKDDTARMLAERATEQLKAMSGAKSA